MPLIPPIIVNDKHVSDYEEKAHHFINSFLHNAHPLIVIFKFLLSCFQHSFLPLFVKTMISLKLLEILTLARSMVDDISIKMVNLLDDSLSMIFQNYINYGSW